MLNHGHRRGGLRPLLVRSRKCDDGRLLQGFYVHGGHDQRKRGECGPTPHGLQEVLQAHKGQGGGSDGEDAGRTDGRRARGDRDGVDDGSKRGGARGVPRMLVPPAGGRREVWPSQDAAGQQLPNGEAGVSWRCPDSQEADDRLRPGNRRGEAQAPG